MKDFRKNLGDKEKVKNLGNIEEEGIKEDLMFKVLLGNKEAIIMVM